MHVRWGVVLVESCPATMENVSKSELKLSLKVMWSTGKEWKIFLEDSHFVWFPTESILYLHYNVGRIDLSGTE